MLSGAMKSIILADQPQCFAEPAGCLGILPVSPPRCLTTLSAAAPQAQDGEAAAHLTTLPCCNSLRMETFGPRAQMMATVGYAFAHGHRYVNDACMRVLIV